MSTLTARSYASISGTSARGPEVASIALIIDGSCRSTYAVEHVEIARLPPDCVDQSGEGGTTACARGPCAHSSRLRVMVCTPEGRNCVNHDRMQA